jgi:hypothetical protein
MHATCASLGCEQQPSTTPARYVQPSPPYHDDMNDFPIYAYCLALLLSALQRKTLLVLRYVS